MQICNRSRPLGESVSTKRAIRRGTSGEKDVLYHNTYLLSER